ncbi:hypothetical protein 1 [Hubei tombus-like virus 8]|uniref:hypothetical protein 1 n=1 Tax=Hubei tombus-like virus 8 TaxID=1923295 RepID=UPI00090CBEDA|nr:hypothetical protein 1 [Hubei tombus-like virus 8]APG76529.1 hypothetical protein 1 [Hubei tombus-like virus 8]
MQNNFYEKREFQVNEVSARHTRERRNLWAEKWDSFKSGFAEMYYTSTFFNLLCCTVPEDHLEFKLDQADRLAVRKALMQSLDYGAHKSIIAATMEDISEHEGYEMRMDPPVKQVPVPSSSSTALIVRNVNLQPQGAVMLKPVKGVQGVRSIPRFTAAVVVALRGKLGQLNPSVQGNELVLEREALRMMRDYNVREVDRAVHLPRVMAAYWSADVHYRVPTVESRMSRFQRWLLNRPSSSPQYAVPRA